LAIPVLLILAVLWAAVLVPPVLRSRSETRRGTVGDFTSRLDALNRQSSPPRSIGPRPERPLHAVPSSRDGSVRQHAPMTPAQKRRRDVLIVVGGAAIATLLLAVVTGNPLLWVLQIAADVLLAAYMFLLVVFLKHRSSPSVSSPGVGAWPAARPSSRPMSLAHPRVPARPELAPFPQAAPPLRRTASG
jgi:Flp pilus assembly protein TadB